MNTQTAVFGSNSSLIQTNHGVSFPIVGTARMKQSQQNMQNRADSQQQSQETNLANTDAANPTDD